MTTINAMHQPLKVPKAAVCSWQTERPLGPRTEKHMSLAPSLRSCIRQMSSNILFAAASN